MEEVERLWGKLGIGWARASLCGKPPVSNVTEVIPNKPDVIANTRQVTAPGQSVCMQTANRPASAAVSAWAAGDAVSIP